MIGSLLLMTTVLAPLTNDVVAAFGPNEIRLSVNPLSYEVRRNGKTLVARTPIGLTLNGKDTSSEAMQGVSYRDNLGSVATPVYKKASVNLANHEAYADFASFGIRLVARPDGVAYRFETKGPATITAENAAVTIPSKSARCAFYRANLHSWGCEEVPAEYADAGSIPQDPTKIFYLPFVYQTEGQVVAVTESDVRDYPIWDFAAATQIGDTVRLTPEFEHYPTNTCHYGKSWKGEPVEKGGRWVKCLGFADYLVQNAAARTLPWRTFILGDSYADLPNADIVFALATPAKPDMDFSWVKPGKTAWDWWNCFDNAPSGAPNGGCTTKTYERFIDFASKNNVEYVIFDEGWSESLNIWKFHPEVDVPYLVKYANERNVGIILWMAWAQVVGDEEHVASEFSKMGVKGFKVDFMDRGDAEVACFLAKFAEVCARYHLVVDYHGTYRPTGLSRAYPNVLNYEGVHGLEQMKFGGTEEIANRDMPGRDVGTFFLRMTAGPMDYTPGAMLNYAYGKYTYGEDRRFPGSVGTRVHQMALMAAYEAPLQMLCDSPTNYEKNMESFSFMAKTPDVWKDTVGLGGSPETYGAVARQAKDGSWYVAFVNNKDPRDAKFSTSFLGSGIWKAEIFRDIPDGAELPMQYIHETKPVSAGSDLSFAMAPGGGLVIHFTK